MSQSEDYTFRLTDADATLDIGISVAKFDAARVPAFQTEFQNAWVPSIKSIRIYMDDVQFIDSSGIGALLSVQKKLADSATPIALHTEQANVVQILELLRLQRVFHIVTDAKTV
ncbi:MAG: STAS domain-containing protein [Opitutales bacterium]